MPSEGLPHVDRALNRISGYRATRTSWPPRRRACSELSRRRGASGRDAAPASLPEPNPSAPSVAGEAQGRGCSARRIGALRPRRGKAEAHRTPPAASDVTTRSFRPQRHCHLLQRLSCWVAARLPAAVRARSPDEPVSSLLARCRPARIHRSRTSTPPVPDRLIGCPRTR